jgi:hypothetical protein
MSNFCKVYKLYDHEDQKIKTFAIVSAYQLLQNKRLKERITSI